jgi:hypothetical protein
LILTMLIQNVANLFGGHSPGPLLWCRTIMNQFDPYWSFMTIPAPCQQKFSVQVDISRN